jgi:hypothetical protein
MHNRKPHEIRIGDYVQWEPQGVLQFSEPKRVIALSECRLWVFVEGSNCGLPIQEVYRDDSVHAGRNQNRPRHQK